MQMDQWTVSNSGCHILAWLCRWCWTLFLTQIQQQWALPICGLSSRYSPPPPRLLLQDCYQFVHIVQHIRNVALLFCVFGLSHLPSQARACSSRGKHALHFGRCQRRMFLNNGLEPGLRVYRNPSTQHLTGRHLVTHALNWCHASPADISRQ